MFKTESDESLFEGFITFEQFSELLENTSAQQPQNATRVKKIRTLGNGDAEREAKLIEMAI